MPKHSKRFDEHKKGGKNSNKVVARTGANDELTKGRSKNTRDPNYDSESDEEDVVYEVTSETTADALALLREYFSSGDREELAANLKETNTAATHNNFVKKALIAGIENGPYERELVSQLLVFLSGKVIDGEKMVQGFEDAILALDDITLDSPGAPEVLGKFLARAIVDEAVPPALISKIPKGKNQRVDDCLSLAAALTTEKHRIDRLTHIWGPGDLSSVKRLKKEVGELLEEFIISDDLEEAENNIRKLNAPSFHFQVVKQALYLALQKQKDSDQTKLLRLLHHCYKTGLLSSQAIHRGFAVCYDRIADLQLDFPHAKQLLDSFAQKAQTEGWYHT
jgi:programmed cell death protein 4